MPHWNCERCGARLYSAARTLKRQTCPVCQGRLSPDGNSEPPGRFDRASHRADDLPSATGVSDGADEHR
jgi:hypothetical protein